MRPHLRLSALYLTMTLLALGAPVGVRAQCDSSWVRLADGQFVSGAAAAREQTYSDSIHIAEYCWPDSCWYWDGSGYLRIALAERRFEAASHSEQSLYFAGWARDEYRIVGAAAGSEITFRMRLVGTVEFVFYEYCGGSGCNPVAGITVDGPPSDHLEMIGIGSYHDQVLDFDRSTTLTRRAGESFTLNYFMQAGTSHSPAYASVDARVEFDGLPPGVRVVSCLEEAVGTTTRPGSWGEIKSRYR